ncbi:PHD finger protein [Platanthera guangdongensis]|uniref:PHD finger protein n=1 Tax=Platanthera guangdongensis TaxID=2320717 RepID=A0ABR2LR79_9ASPA
MEDVLPEGTMLQYMVNGITKLVGYAKDSGIFCSCCNAVVSPSQFEAHAGQAQRRKPYNYIYTSNGVSLHELSIILSKRRKLLDSQNDDLCSICEDAGELVLCDLCPRLFIRVCAELSSVPEGDWHCKYCENMHQRENYVKYNDNARAAGRVVGVDAIDQIMKRCILIVKIPDSRVGGCALCRCKDYAKSVFGERTVLICDQCEKEYHVGCLKIHGMGDLKEKPEGDWFCCVKCITIHATLQYVSSIGAQELPIQALDVIKRNNSNKRSIRDAGVDLKWRLFRGKTASASDKVFLSDAVSVLHESFDPIISGKKGTDLFTQLVFGRSWCHMDLQGMYCAVLIANSVVVSVSVLRVLGSDVAEVPLVATRKDCQGQGYFAALFACIGRLLASLNVEHLVLPATDDAQAMWTQKFGFTKISLDQLHSLARGIKIVDFEGTKLLHRTVSDLLPPFENRGC